MRKLLLPFVLILSAAASAQDRASVEAFFHEYDAAVKTGDLEWVAVHLDPTAIYRDSEGYMEVYQDPKPMLEAYRKEKVHYKRPMASFDTTIDKLDLRGERAIVDITSREVSPGGRPTHYARSLRMVLTHKDGVWKMWRVWTGPLKTEKV